MDTTAAVNGNGKSSGATLHPILPQSPYEGLFRLETIARALAKVRIEGQWARFGLF
jgi:hypothetical protein